MSTARRLVRAGPSRVWRVLADARACASWLPVGAGASWAEGSWPAPGSSLVLRRRPRGAGVVLVTVVSADVETWLHLHCGRWPGEEQLRVRLAPRPEGTAVTLERLPLGRGPARAVHLLRRASSPRSAGESLATLARLAEEDPGGGPGARLRGGADDTPRHTAGGTAGARAPGTADVPSQRRPGRTGPVRPGTGTRMPGPRPTSAVAR